MVSNKTCARHSTNNHIAIKTKSCEYLHGPIKWMGLAKVGRPMEVTDLVQAWLGLDEVGGPSKLLPADPSGKT